MAYKDKPILQFIFLGSDGEPVAVCVTPAKTVNQEIEIMSLAFAGLNTVSWGRFGSVFMLISKEPQHKLEKMTESLLAKQTI